MQWQGESALLCFIATKDNKLPTPSSLEYPHIYSYYTTLHYYYHIALKILGGYTYYMKESSLEAHRPMPYRQLQPNVTCCKSMLVRTE